MRSWTLRATAIVALCSAATGSALRAQIAADSTRQTDLPSAARSIIAAAKYAALITTDRLGAPQSRTIQPMAPTADWEIWFATNPRTRKVGEIARDPRVVLHYFDAATLSYASLHGRATVVRDRRTKDAHWDPAWDTFYPDRDSSVALIRVRVQRMEVVSTNLKIVGDPKTWRPPSVTVRPPR